MPKKKPLNRKSGVVSTLNSEIITESPSRSEVDNPINQTGSSKSPKKQKTRARKTTVAFNEVNLLNTEELLVKKKNTRRSKFNVAEGEVFKKGKSRELDTENSV